MSELTDFLTACLDADEQAALAATPGPWAYNPRKQWHAPPSAFGTPSPGEEYVRGGTADEPTCVAATGPADDPQSMADARFIASQNPARVLADIAAKRAVLDDCRMAFEQEEERMKVRGASHPSSAHWGLAAGVVEHLVQSYAGRPGWHEDWATGWATGTVGPTG